MTVISALITRYCTVHASDSLITRRTNGTYEIVEAQQPKIVPVYRWRGAMSYWGLAECAEYEWSTFDWLQEQVKKDDQSSAEDFAYQLAENLNKALSRMRFSEPVHYGIGVHFTTYEYIDNYWIPELFLISNWASTSYCSLRRGGVGVTRETFHTAAQTENQPEHRDAQYRLKVHEYLLQPGAMLMYNNGDPRLFNSAANAMFGMFRELGRRGKLANPNRIETYCAIARRPIEVVSSAQQDFCSEGSRIAGGKPHDLAITPNGDYASTTGDKY